MIRDITIGQYYPVDSPIHRLDPRVKLAGTMLFLISLFVLQLAQLQLFPQSLWVNSKSGRDMHFCQFTLCICFS